MTDPHNLQRFIDAQDGIFETAFAELHAGRKQSHWMWFVFPQLAGLGHSQTARYYGVASLDEGHAYLEHPILGPRLRQSGEALLTWSGERSPDEIFGPIDSLKLRSSLTLFDQISRRDIFAEALDAFFDGEQDERTLALLNGGG